jgi:hypothetical protein
MESKLFHLAAWVVLCLLCAVVARGENRKTVDDLLDAIEQVESGGDVNAVGDGGRAIGPMQIHRVYWLDAKMPGRYEQVKYRRYARQTVLRYWHRYAGKALTDGDWETLARTHNGGPQGARKDATLHYWVKVKRVLYDQSRD